VTPAKIEEVAAVGLVVEDEADVAVGLRDGLQVARAGERGVQETPVLRLLVEPCQESRARMGTSREEYRMIRLIPSPSYRGDAVARLPSVAIALLTFVSSASAQQPDWRQVQREATALLQQYVRIDTSIPPGDVTKAADLLQGVLEKEGIPVTRYESGPGRSILLARLKGTGGGKPIVLLHHMDVVPADASRWTRNPFGAEIADGKLWGRGAMDMKGLGVAHLMAFLSLKRQNVSLSRDVILLVVPDEEIGGELGNRWMIERHWAELDPEYVLDEGGVGSADLFAAGKRVYGISVAEKKILWLKLTAEGVAGHGSQPHDRNPNDRLVRALAKLLAQPLPSSAFSVLQTMKARVGTFAANKFTNAIQHSTISLTTMKAGVGEPAKVNVIPSVAEATLDCRVLPGTTKEQWLAEIRRRLGDPEIKIEVVYESEDPVVTTTDSALYRALESAVKRDDPDAIVTPMIIPYGTDSNAYRPKGVKSYGFFPALLPADVLASMHGDAEFIPVEVLATAARRFYEAIREVAGK
jgi:acetylornithine deacetylase/succinyl-diaminopimelate desuccinylase-like protein